MSLFRIGFGITISAPHMHAHALGKLFFDCIVVKDTQLLLPTIEVVILQYEIMQENFNFLCNYMFNNKVKIYISFRVVER